MKSKTKHTTLSQMQKNAAAAEGLLKQMANANRLMLLCAMVSAEKSVAELVEICGVSQSAVSQHLAGLREAGLVNAQKRGKQVYYQVASVEVQAILSTLYLIYCRN